MWVLVDTDDKTIRPDGERCMATRAVAQPIEAAASHSVPLSQPKDPRTAVTAVSTDDDGLT